MVTHRNIAEWRGKQLVDLTGDKIGKLEDVYVDVETDEPIFGTVKEGLVNRHLTFVPLAGLTIGPDSLQVVVSKEQVESAPDIASEDEELSPDRRIDPLSLLPAQLHRRPGHRADAGSRAADRDAESTRSRRRD